ncbi:HAD-superfamily hydrolase [Aspergillus sclerotioniger CBS 115572]|uniref:HAD-superfamily hydrolase n=1 Tax=Aspergillus sclerotioniger CBS 115572 TaxID=1450535 RepID=A0A317W5F8_9EURO|nr:HAD-superfamily hydrolase [Aspergillus sclerotioniger CBS 115572]PWY80278.1 HAD-superfamily hydrolase [Aspergillus sclerotioniger CBS 115572]
MKQPLRWIWPNNTWTTTFLPRKAPPVLLPRLPRSLSPLLMISPWPSILTACLSGEVRLSLKLVLLSNILMERIRTGSKCMYLISFRLSSQSCSFFRSWKRADCYFSSPYIFVTNGGGKTEEERCLDLSRQLELDVSPGQFICGHTPMREMAERYHTVLVVGGEGEKCRVVAEGYGFKDVITPGDIIKTRHDTTPFRKLTEEEHKNSRVRDFEQTRIEAIFVFADSRDWAGDQQIILDCLMSKDGRLGTRSETFDEGPPLFFSHNDVVWSTSHEHSRIGMGALRASLEALYKAVTGKELTTIAFGKPQLGTYQFAMRLLRQWRKNTHGINKPPRTVYFVGDTPESDIRGTNEFNEISDAHWFSILVKTGVYQEGTIPRYPPKRVCNNILDAVKFAIDREMSKGDKESAIMDDVDSGIDSETALCN